MAPVITPWTTFILDRVASGPQDWNRLVSEAASLVPPGRAFREAERHLEYRRPEDEGRRWIDEHAKKDQRIRWGQRGIITAALSGLASNGRIEITMSEGQKLVSVGSNPASSAKPTRAVSGTCAGEVMMLVEDDEMLLDDVFDIVLPVINREMAIHTGRRIRDSVRRRRGSEADTDHTDEDDFKSGARQMFTASVRNLAKSKRIVVVGSGPYRFIRRGPAWVEPASR